MNAIIKNIARAVVVCAGLAATGVVLSHDCAKAVPTDSAAIPDVDEAKTLSASELHDVFHDSRLNQGDGLGDYVQNFQPD